MVRVVLLCLLLSPTACGRFGFGTVPGDAGDSIPYGGPKFLVAAPPSHASTSSTWEDIPGPSLTIETHVEETWLILLCARLRSSSTAEPAAAMRYLVDGSLKGMAAIQNGTPDGPLPWMHVHALIGDGLPHKLAVQIMALAGTASVDGLRVIAFPLPPSADFHLDEDDGPTNVTGPAWAPYLELVFTPPSPGPYLVVVSLNGSEAPGTGDVDVRVATTTGGFWPTAPFHQHRQYFLPMYAARSLALDATTQTITI